MDQQRDSECCRGLRFAVLADVHGNLPALEAVLDDVRRYDVDGIWALGDLIGGPGQNRIVHLLRALDAVLIRGNNENYLLEFDDGDAPERRTARQWAPMRWAYHDLEPALLDFVAAWPEQRVVAPDGAAPVRLVHGSPRRANEPLFPDRDAERMQRFQEAGFFVDGRRPTPLREALAGIDEPALACGHTHIPWVQCQDGCLAFNPGSVGGAIDGDTRAQYALLTWRDGAWHVELRAVAYDFERLRQDFVESGFLAQAGALARAMLLGIGNGQNAAYYLVIHAARLAAQAGLDGGLVVPDSVWERAVETLDWELAASGRPLF